MLLFINSKILDFEVMVSNMFLDHRMQNGVKKGSKRGAKPGSKMGSKKVYDFG